MDIGFLKGWSVTLLPKALFKAVQKERDREKYILISFMNIDARILNEMFADIYTLKRHNN